MTFCIPRAFAWRVRLADHARNRSAGVHSKSRSPRGLGFENLKPRIAKIGPDACKATKKRWKNEYEIITCSRRSSRIGTSHLRLEIGNQRAPHTGYYDGHWKSTLKMTTWHLPSHGLLNCPIEEEESGKNRRPTLLFLIITFL